MIIKTSWRMLVLWLHLNQLTVQLDGEPVFHIHTARLGNPSYCWGILLSKKDDKSISISAIDNLRFHNSEFQHIQVSPMAAWGQTGSPAHKVHPPYSWSQPSQLEHTINKMDKCMYETAIRTIHNKQTGAYCILCGYSVKSLMILLKVNEDISQYWGNII